MAQNRDIGYKDIRIAEENLEGEIHRSLNSEKIPYEAHLLISRQSFGEELVDYAEQNKVDEIIIGIRKRSKVGKLVFGSTAQYVILNASCPVVSIK
jgi:nucleotide-binding universal stress UspA family protein